jgi:hypothetical protein
MSFSGIAVKLTVSWAEQLLLMYTYMITLQKPGGHQDIFRREW